MNPITINDLADFILNLFNATNSYLFFGLTFMFAAHTMVLIRRLLVGYR